MTAKNGIRKSTLRYQDKLDIYVLLWGVEKCFEGLISLLRKM